MLGVRLAGHGGGHDGGAVQFLLRHGGESLVESAFHAEQVDPFDEGEDGIGVGGVGAVGVAAGLPPRGISSTR